MTNEEFFDSPYRGVTSVLNAIFGNKFENSDIPEHVLKAAAERGTACHSYIEKYQKWLLSDELKEEDEPHLGLEYAQYETNFKKWLEERCEIVQPILIEHKIISKKLGITSRSVQNKRSGNTGWLLSEYMLLVKYYGQDIADEMVNIANTNKDLLSIDDKMEEK